MGEQGRSRGGSRKIEVERRWGSGRRATWSQVYNDQDVGLVNASQGSRRAVRDDGRLRRRARPSAVVRPSRRWAAGRSSDVDAARSSYWEAVERFAAGPERRSASQRSFLPKGPVRAGCRPRGVLQTDGRWFEPLGQRRRPTNEDCRDPNGVEMQRGRPGERGRPFEAVAQRRRGGLQAWRACGAAGRCVDCATEGGGVEARGEALRSERSQEVISEPPRETRPRA